MQNNKLTCAGLGAFLATGAPLGWVLVTILDEDKDSSFLLYIYLWLSTTVVFASFGWYLGGLLEKIGRLADTDRLTGLLNQSAFRSIAEKLSSYCQREGVEQCVVMLDIDYFKQVNDKADHLFGSYVIQELGRLLANDCRQSDVLARYGGDEFVIFLPATDAQHAATLCNRIRDHVTSRLFAQGRHQTKITLSFGIASSKNASLNELIARADEALYASKKDGRDRFSIYRPMETSVKRSGGAA